MIDFHSHILPQMDDGSQSVEESLEMLAEEKKQGVRAVVATPHFYPEQEAISDFLVRRKEAAAKLVKAMEGKDLPTLYLAAETAYYYGMSRSDDLPLLCIGGTRSILIEMPFTVWSDSIVKEISMMNENLGFQPILAHIERYIAAISKKTMIGLCDKGVLFQCNAAFFAERKTRRKALKLFSTGMVGFLGTDAHNMKTRPPRLGEAYGVLTEKFGSSEMSYFDEFEDDAIENAETAVDYLREKQ